MVKTENKFGGGIKIEEGNWNVLNNKLNNKVPDWLIAVFSKYPIAHSTIEIKDVNDEEIEYRLEFVSPRWMESETLEAYPGCAIFDLGYICIAADPTGGGDPYFINIEEGNNPAIYQVYHDVSDKAEEIVTHGRQKIADTFSELFERGELIEE